jgi:hypothetical protein
MTPSLRQAWTELVTAEDYEAHMAAIGQAEANADLVRAVLDRWPPPGERLLFAGAGTGQMFDYVAPDFLAVRRVTFTDLNPRFLERLASRLGPAPWYETEVDDLEASGLAGDYAGVVVVLVLEHIDWRAGVRSLGRLGAARCYLVVQENPPEIATAVTPGRPPVGTMEVFRRACPRLIPPAEVDAEMAEQGYRPLGRTSRPVADGKYMTALVFERA